ncbi:MAG: hypothetical protein M5U19_17075 [Microthrixaceae bacterium]|nr:hypothetical protein [Microthrixaceae bacterium]
MPFAVVLHGTGAGTTGYGEITSALRSDGYHVIVLRYSAALGTLGACPDSVSSSFPDCHRAFRSETVFGAGVQDPSGDAFDHPGAQVPAADSLVNRLLKLIERMKVIAPSAGWGQFQDATSGVCNNMNTTYGACELKWSKVALIGHSQGAGVALYMSKFFPLRAEGSCRGHTTRSGLLRRRPPLPHGPPNPGSPRPIRRSESCGTPRTTKASGSLLWPMRWAYPDPRSLPPRRPSQGTGWSLQGSPRVRGIPHRTTTPRPSTCVPPTGPTSMHGVPSPEADIRARSRSCGATPTHSTR